MPMTYREFRTMIKGMGLDEIWRQPVEGYELALIGQKQGIVYPFAFVGREVILPKGDDTVIEDEEIQAHMRWIEKLLGRSCGS